MRPVRYFSDKNIKLHYKKSDVNFILTGKLLVKRVKFLKKSSTYYSLDSRPELLVDF